MLRGVWVFTAGGETADVKKQDSSGNKLKA
jgi:hypothetical protein